MNKDIVVHTKIGWNFDNSYAKLPALFFSRLSPTAVPAPELVILNCPLTSQLGLDADELRGKDGITIIAGNQIPKGANPLAQAYAGHQFGHFSMLGDGRALIIGEQITPSGERFDIQLKGSGPTPYSRGGDGKAVLGPMLREYTISEAMHGLGIPTSRSLAVIKTGEMVLRESYLSGAVLTRVAASHIRVGTFQYAANWGTTEELRILADYTIKRHFSNLEGSENRYLSLLQEVIKRQASLIAKWQLVGFIHGVMNTDNMAISGETIDYGPCAFMDEYDPATVFSSIDIYGRYAYENQPKIAQWNLARFAETLLPLLHDNENRAVEIAEDVVSTFADLYYCNWLDGMRAKLGFLTKEDQDEELILSLLNIMHKYRADYTNTFRTLTTADNMDIDIFGSEEYNQWHGLWQLRLDRQNKDKAESHRLMQESNPAVIPRNHRVEEALKVAVEYADYSVMNRLLNILSQPYGYIPEQDEYAKLPKPSGVPYRTYCGT